jgi:hypothetical protein
VKRRLGSWCERADSQGTQLVELSVNKTSARETVTRGPERGKLKNLQWWKPLLRKGFMYMSRIRMESTVFWLVTSG